MQWKWNPWFAASVVPVVIGPIWVVFGVVFINDISVPCFTLTTLILVSATFAAAVDDTFRKRIANWITYPAFLWLFLVSLASSLFPGNTAWLGSVGFGDMLLGFLCCFTIVLLPYIFGVGGGGDAKIAAVIGAGLGLQYGLIAIGFAFVLAAIFAIGRETIQKGPFFVVRTFYRRLGSWFSIWVLPPSEEGQKILNHPLPMGVSFFCGVVLTITDIIPSIIL